MAVSSAPCGALMWRVLSMTGHGALANVRQASRICFSTPRMGAANSDHSGAGQFCGVGSPCGSSHIAAAGQLHLDGVHAALRLAIVPRGPAALEAAIGHPGMAAGRRTALRPHAASGARAARAAIGADIELRQLAVEQARDHASGWNGRHTARSVSCVRAQPRDLMRQRARDRDRNSVRACGPISTAPGALACGVKRLAVEGFGRAQPGRGLARDRAIGRTDRD